MTTLILIWIVASFLFSAWVGRAATLGWADGETGDE